VSAGREALVAPPEVLAALEASHDADLAALLDLIRIPSVSADSRHAADVRRAATTVADYLRAAGVDDVEIHETGRHPVVTAAWRGAPGAPTVLVYGHYDVQPPEPLDGWATPPFEPTLRDGRIYARGASDDKSPMFIPLTVVAAYLRTTGALPVNVVFLLEGEEEIGSPSLAPFVRRETERLQADMVLSADGGMWRPEHPSTMISSRGMTAIEFTVRGAAKDLHSGRHGGGVANPLHALASLVASLHDADGRVAVGGFYDDVRPIPEDVRAVTRSLPFDDATYLAEVGAPATFGEAGFSTLERQWNRPTLELNGMWGGYTGEGSKTVLPSAAHAKVTCRLVADQDPDDVRDKVVRHLHHHLPPGVTLEVRSERPGARAYRIRDGHPGLATAVATLRAVYGVEPWVIGMGGTLPIVETFQRHLGMDTVFFSFAVGDEDIHAPNEFFRVHRFAEGRRAWADYLARLPRMMSASRGAT
jgi:acetylornithine deacetylase/succinyl-diaminopimelate desuccinylase-like protein